MAARATRSRRRSRAGRTRLAPLWPLSMNSLSSRTRWPSREARAVSSLSWLSMVCRSACWSEETLA
jgi:hypothetical protein